MLKSEAGHTFQLFGVTLGHRASVAELGPPVLKRGRTEFLPLPRQSILLERIRRSKGNAAGSCIEWRSGHCEGIVMRLSRPITLTHEDGDRQHPGTSSLLFLINVRCIVSAPRMVAMEWPLQS